MIFAMVALAAGGVAALAALRRTGNADYWLAGGAVLIPLLLVLGGKVMRKGERAKSQDLEEELTELREYVKGQWGKEVEQKIALYKLPVPISTISQVPIRIPVAAGPGVATTETLVRVMDSWAGITDDSGERPELEGTFGDIARLFQQAGLPSRMVVLGERGSGKSVIAQWLTVLLVGGGGKTADKRQASDLPASELVPVLLPLPSWDPAMELAAWAEQQMTRIYPWLNRQVQAPGGRMRSLAGELIARKRVLMVLDGLDEVSPANRLKAFKKLSDSAKAQQPMVITCRTTAYGEIVHEADHYLARTPVIKLDRLPLHEVRAYFTKADPAGTDRFEPLLDRVEAAPDGSLARALTSPFALYLVSTYYQRRGSDPSELLGIDDESAILQHLLDGLIEALYSIEVLDWPAAEDDAELASTRRRLSHVAQMLGSDVEKQNIDWWRIPEQVPKWFTGGIIGTTVGCVLGAAVGFATSVKFTPKVGLVLGVVFAVVTGVLAGVTSVRPQDHPRTVEIRWRWNYWRFVGCLSVGMAVGIVSAYADHLHGGLMAGLVTAVVVGPLCALPCIKSFGMAPGITAGVTASLALGLSSGLAVGNGHLVVSGVLAGAAFAIAGWVFVSFFQPAEDKFEVSPASLYDRDRDGSLVVATTAGMAFAVVYGVALNALIGVVAFVALTVAVAVTVSMWGAFQVSRLWLALTGGMPLRLMTFLHEAYDRGVLRQFGGSYQFRHMELKQALLPSPAQPRSREGGLERELQRSGAD